MLSKLLIDPENLIQIMDADLRNPTCEPITKFLTHTSLYSYLELSQCVGQTLAVNLKNKKTWVSQNLDPKPLTLQKQSSF